MRRFDDDFVCAQRAHFVVHAFGQAARFTLNTIKRIGMRNHAHLPRAFAREAENRGALVDVGRVKGTRRSRLIEIFGLAQHYPTLRDWIAADFHEGWSAEVALWIFCAAPSRWNERNSRLRTWQQNLDHAQ